MVSMYTLHISVSDGYLSTTNMLTVNVLNTPDPPVFINLDENLSVGESTLGNIAQFMFSDSDRDHVTLTMNVIGQMANSPFVLSGLGRDYSILMISQHSNKRPICTKLIWKNSKRDIHNTEQNSKSNVKIGPDIMKF